MVLALTLTFLPTQEKIHNLIFFICKCPLSFTQERGLKNQSHAFKSLLRFVF